MSITIWDKTFEPYFSRLQIENAVNRLADEINRDYAGQEVVLIGVLDGVVLFFSDLTRRLKFDVTIELIKLKSYHGTSSTGTIKELIGFSQNLEGKKILIAEDIIDTGQTLQHLFKMLEKKSPASIEVVTLLLKPEVFGEKFPIKYVGKKIENKFVVGFGMDYDGKGRQLPDIYAASEQTPT
ncbi:MAG: hypoxanthine phosphoribosyltransferase [Cyclobacteriaceae bacterium]